MHNSSDSTPSDLELAARVQAQDGSAFELLYERYNPAIQRHVEAIVRAPAAAQDLAQEVFLRVWTRADQWTGQGSFKGWLYRIATNLALNHLRSLRRHPVEALPSEDEGGWDEWDEAEEIRAPGWLIDTGALGPDLAVEDAERITALRRSMARLPEEKREVVRLVHEMELSIRDTAGRLGIPEGTVKSRLHYAEKQIEQAWRTLTSDEE